MTDVINSVVWRVATLADHDAILRLDPGGGAYDISDSLPERLRGYLSDPLTICIMGLLGEKVVVFHFIILLDDGKRLLARGGRSDKSYRSSGLFKEVRHKIIQAALERFPQRKVKTGMICMTGFSMHMAAQLGYPDIALIRNYFHLKMETADTKYILPQNSEPLPRYIGIDECVCLINDKRINWKLFPSSFVVIGREPFKILPCNFARMFKYCKAVYGTFEQTNLKNLRTISFGSGFHYKDTYIYELDIYSSTPTADQVVNQILSHIPNVRMLAMNSNFIITPFFPMQIDPNEVLVKLSPGLVIHGVPAKHLALSFPIDKFVGVSRIHAKL